MAYTDWGNFCRLIRVAHGPSTGMWQWALNGSSNPFGRLPYGACETKEEAADLIKRMFIELRDSKRLEFHRPFVWKSGISWDD